MKNTILRTLALILTAAFCALTFTGCTIDVRQLLGMSSDTVEEKQLFIVAEEGGNDVPYPDGFDTTARFATEITGDTMCIVFNRIMSRSTGYFSTSGDTITLTSAATTESSGLFEYKAALWRKTETGTEYMQDCTVQFCADGELYTAEISGLDPSERYKLVLSYDSGLYSITGGMSVTGLATAETVDDTVDDAA